VVTTTYTVVPAITPPSTEAPDLKLAELVRLQKSAQRINATLTSTRSLNES